MEFFDGRAHAKILDNKIQQELSKPERADSFGVLAIIQIGNNPVSESYINLKLKYSERIGVPSQYFHLDAMLSDKELHSKIEDIFSRKEITGGIIQLPLPRPSLNSVLNLIPLDKDIDVLSGKTLTQSGHTMSFRFSPVVLAFNYFMAVNSIKIHNLSIKIIGRGQLVGVPVMEFLLQREAKAGFLDDYKVGESIDADMIVTCTGVPNILKGEALKPGCHVIDFGSAHHEGKTVGDFDLNSKLNHLGIVSPSPGGMGPLVIRFLIMNHLKIKL